MDYPMYLVDSCTVYDSKLPGRNGNQRLDGADLYFYVSLVSPQPFRCADVELKNEKKAFHHCHNVISFLFHVLVLLCLADAGIRLFLGFSGTAGGKN